MNLKNKITVLTAALLIPAAAAAAETDLISLVGTALETNADIRAAGLELSAEQAAYAAAGAGALPKLGFTSGGTNPLYGFSNADEFSFTSFSNERRNRHKLGGGLSITAALPTGGSLVLGGTGGLEIFAAAEDGADWNYLLTPAASLSLRQPLFTDRIGGGPMRLDSLALADELARLRLDGAALSLAAAENRLILLTAAAAARLNSLRSSRSIIDKRISLVEKRLDLALLDEKSGRLSSLDRLAEELQLRRLTETQTELEFQTMAAGRDLLLLSGEKVLPEGIIDMKLPRAAAGGAVSGADAGNAFAVQSSASAARSVEISASVFPNGNEPVFEASASYRRSDSDSSADLGSAFEAMTAAKMDFSLSIGFSMSVVDWGEGGEKARADRERLAAANERLGAARENAAAAVAAAHENLSLIDKKIELLIKGLDYDESLLKRERVRLGAGLSTEAAVETIELDLLEREYTIRQLQDERAIALLQLHDAGGRRLSGLFGY